MKIRLPTDIMQQLQLKTLARLLKFLAIDSKDGDVD